MTAGIIMTGVFMMGRNLLLLNWVQTTTERENKSIRRTIETGYEDIVSWLRLLVFFIY